VHPPVATEGYRHMRNAKKTQKTGIKRHGKETLMTTILT
jgi:hypothetical protein